MSWSGFMNSRQNGSKFSLGKITKQQWLVLLLVGILLAVIALPVKEPSTAQQSSDSISFTDSGESSVFTEKDYMEQQMEEILSQVEGVGQVEVLLSLSGENSVSFYSGEGVPEVEGVLIVAQGAGNSVVERNIQQAVMALFSVEAHKIKIMKMI